MHSRPRRESRRRCFCGLALAALAWMAVGCTGGDRRQNVSGTVTLDGRPLTQGQVLLYGPNNQLFSASIRGDGTFTITDVVPGELQVAVTDPGARMARLPTTGDPSMSGEPAAPRASAVPAKYQKPETSGLRFTIAPDSGPVEIAMRSK